ncbi:DHHC zinc finger protein (macronuclear) [Tetrahymena thermophila SB210]|uniref:DHHC zinc finger protein n=1 Tax=Tetrahymena thermophila (strain SB210) TaxID=312017 RepID=I7MJT8_TETTS|nr:DHHC zinc finger protein [Tetrahymena thermophila SB210]EAS07191.3 DHHC zinc finger protein [Tetrahymena thermophila SB210]|eukprot:XP_001027433.3 DHHC zinc finger protein [Tetrahymena thermophila SB210]
MKLTRIIIAFLIINYYAVSELFNHFEIDKIDNCVEYVYAPSRFNYYLYDQALCIQCELGYVVSKNYKQCIHFIFQLSYPKYGNCKRLAEDGKCAEALDGIELLPNNLYTIVKDQKFLERCAIVDESESVCIFPRFGFILDEYTNSIFKDTHMTFCALYNSKYNKCTKFQQRFLRKENTQLGVYLGENFISPHLLLPNSSTYYLSCQNNYLFLTKFLNQFDGCFDDNFLQDINNLYCTSNHALRDDKLKCEIIIHFCQEYTEIEGNQLCIKCIPFYRLHLQTCVELLGCEVISKVNSNKCLKCSTNRVLINGECILKDQRSLQKKNLDEQSKLKKYTHKQLRKYNSINQLNQSIFGLENSIQKQANQNQKNEVNLNQRILKNIEKNLEILEKQGKNKQQILPQDNILQQNYDQNNDKCKQCIFDDEMQCISCINEDCYLNEEKNRCLQRQQSFYCQDKIYNSDNCQNLICQSQTILNPILIQNFDLKNIETITYLNNLLDMSFQINSVVSHNEFENFIQKYQFYGINNKANIQICTQFHQYLTEGDEIYFQGNNFYKCDKIRYQILKNFNLPFIVFRCSNELNVQNIFYENCFSYDLEKSFCLQCLQGFHFNSETMVCEKNIQNCIIHSIYNTCIICKSGYKLINGICQEICGIPVPGSVTQFHSFYVLEKSGNKQTICKNTSIPCKRFINDRCFECFEGYVLDYSSNFSCIKDTHFPDCKIIDQFEQNNEIKNQNMNTFDGKKCIQCIDEYNLFQGLCFCQKMNCLNHITCNQNVCYKKFRSLFIGQINLEVTQYLEKQGDFYKVLNCSIPYCLACHEGNICIKCMFGYFYEASQQTCIAINQKNYIQIEQEKQACLDYSIKDKCQKCKHGYYLMPDFKCYRKCLPGYQIINNIKFGSICYKVPYACHRYTFSIEVYLNYGIVTCYQCFKNYFLYLETNECKKICIYYKNKIQDSQFQCLKHCQYTYLLEGRECTLYCPKFYKIINGQNFCADSCQGLYRYEDNNLKCTNVCQEGYQPIRKDLVCRKCQDKNCLRCSNKQFQFCFKCNINYTSIEGKCKYICSNFAIVDNISDCSTDNLVQYCITEKQGKCIKCEDNFSYDEQQNKCICQPTIGYFEYKTKTCQKFCDKNCLICNNNNKCIQCMPNKFLIKNELITICTDKCPVGYYPLKKNSEGTFLECVKCPLHCFSCINSYTCTECNHLYEEYSCNNQTDNVYCILPYQQIKDNQSVPIRYQCCKVQNCDICSQDSLQICEKCDHSYPFLYLNTCLEKCPEGTYADEQNICQRCHPLCRTCSFKLATSCLSCVLPKNMVESDQTCRCSNQNFFFLDYCYSECPKFTMILDGEVSRMCKQFCQDYNSYPVFDDKGVFEFCEYNIDQQNSKFCEQNLVNLNKYITLEMKNSEQNSQVQSILITIRISQTPKECYEFNLNTNARMTEDALNLEFIEFKVDKYHNYYFLLQSKVNISQLTQRDINKCKQNICTLFLQIYQGGILKKIIVLKINLITQVIVIKSIQQTNLNTIQKKQFEQYQIQNQPLLNSVMSVNCEDFIVCNYQSIISYPSISLIFDIQVLFDNTNETKQSLALIPIQVYIIQQNNKLIPIDNLFYDNFYPSKLKIEISFNELVEGKLVFLIKVRDWKDYLLGYQYLMNKNKQNKYIQQFIDIKIKSKNNPTNNKNIDQNQNYIDLKYKIIIIFNIIVCILIIILVIFNCIRKIKIKIPAYQQQYDEQESSIFQQTSSCFHNEEQIKSKSDKYLFNSR